MTKKLRWIAGMLCAAMVPVLGGCTAQPSQSPQSSVPATSSQEEQQTAFTYADTIAWDAEYDVVVIGFGGAGGVSAITAADEGADVLILEKAPLGEEGGNTKYAGQLVNFVKDEDVEGAIDYMKALQNGFSSTSDVMIERYIEGMTTVDDWLLEMGMSPDSFMLSSLEYPELADGPKFWTYLPEGTSFGDAFNGEYWNLVRRNVMSREIDVWYSAPATHLLQDPQSGTIVGVEAEREGRTYRIRALNGVVMACGGFENNPEMLECFTQTAGLHPIGTLYNTGDGVRMAMEVGANLWHMGAISGPFISYLCPETGDVRVPFEEMDQNITAGLSVINVGPDAKRFTDESQKTRHGHVSHNGEYAQQYLFDTMYAVFDEAARLAGPIYPGYSQDNSEEVASGVIIRADTIQELAEKIGLDPQALEATVEEYNRNCADGVDPYFNRPVDKLVPIGDGPYYAVKLVKALINTQGGAERNENCEVIGLDGNPIPHLYSAGEFGSITADIYQGGCNLAETVVSGRVAGSNAAAAKDPLPAFEAYTPVEQGEVGRLTFDEDSQNQFVAGENEYIGTGTGVAPITVKVTLDNGDIASVEILEQNETPGISDEALAQMPERIVEANGVEDVDCVSGATKTSRGILEAVADALSQAG